MARSHQHFVLSDTRMSETNVGFSVVCTSPRGAGHTVGVEEHHQQRRVKQKVHFRVNWSRKMFCFELPPPPVVAAHCFKSQERKVSVSGLAA